MRDLLRRLRSNDVLGNAPAARNLSKYFIEQCSNIARITRSIF